MTRTYNRDVRGRFSTGSKVGGGLRGKISAARTRRSNVKALKKELNGHLNSVDSKLWDGAISNRAHSAKERSLKRAYGKKIAAARKG